MGRKKAIKKQTTAEQDARFQAYRKYCKSVNRNTPTADHYPAYVYFIDNHMGYIKVGWSTNYKQRLSMLQTATPLWLSVWALLGCNDRSEAQRIEKYLHVLFDDVRVTNEWFEFTPAFHQKAVQFLSGELFPELEYEHITLDED